MVYTKENEDIRGVITFNRREQKCEISHAYLDLDEDTVWKLDYGRYGCMADKNLTIGRIDARLASDLRDSERAFELLYGEVINRLNDLEAVEITEMERRRILTDMGRCVCGRVCQFEKFY